MSIKKTIFNNKKIPIYAFLFSLIIVYYFYSSLLAPIYNKFLEFSFGDFSMIISSNSGEIRKNVQFYTFNDRLGKQATTTNRAFLLESISIFSSFFGIKDNQIQSTIILVSVLLGSCGLYKMISLFEKNIFHQSLLIPIIIPFYFLNLLCVERIVHLWIWTAYAIFPLFLFLGISYIYRKKIYHIILYSVLFAFFGIIPHSFIYLLILHFL